MAARFSNVHTEQVQGPAAFALAAASAFMAALLARATFCAFAFAFLLILADFVPAAESAAAAARFFWLAAASFFVASVCSKC